MSELITVIMSTYNEEPAWIKESIESILNQTYSNIEFIIVLDNPNNLILYNTLNNYKKKDKRIKLIINKENVGLVKSLNVALDKSTGHYIARMDADDISDKDRLKQEKEYLEKHQLDFVFSGMTIIDEEGSHLYDMNNTELPAERVKYDLGHFNISNHPTWFMKKEIYGKLGGYRNIPYCEDYDFSLRALINEYKIGKVNNNLLKYRIRKSSISRSYEFEQFLMARKILKLYENGKLNEDLYVQKEIIELSKKISVDKKNKYIKAKSLFQLGNKLIKNANYYRGSFEMLKGAFTSKYYMLKIMITLKYKFKNMFV